MTERRCLYELEFLVRDHECGMEGIINNGGNRRRPGEIGEEKGCIRRIRGRR
jgi:hypothetical protein